ncbi:hypothetical protein E1212_09600 [Jiangella ureilytica]|uniref:Uncharacterized protein n=1 Tax=Jiangella ureilytica TaxID=2530374 RepID=A0A4R4RRS7_9ACTN|nr:hypothetical protein [Jiangella ureilytica]TDC52296.1 hypothetical protein E1212_09600 [Jiangella ureilytica]
MTSDENALRAALTAATNGLDPDGDVLRRARDGGRRRLRRHRVQVGAASVLTAAAVAGGVLPLLGGTGSQTTTPQPATMAPSDLPTGVGGDCEDLPGYGYRITPAELPDEVRLLWPDDGRLDVREAWPRMETGPCGGDGEVSLADVDADGVIVRLAVVSGPEPADVVPAGTAPGTLVPGPEDGEAGRRDLAWLLPDGRQLRIDADGFTPAELADLAATATVEDGVVDLSDWQAAMGIEHVGERGQARSTLYDWTVSGPQGSLTVQTAAGGIYGWGLVGDRLVDVAGRPALLRREGALVWVPAPGVIATLTLAEGLDPLEIAATVGPVPADDQRVVDAAAAVPEAEPSETPTATR